MWHSFILLFWEIFKLVGIFLACADLFNRVRQILKGDSIPEPIFVVTNKRDCERACKVLREHCQDLNALGFDCEWVNYYGQQRPVALLQLATLRGFCCLFRLNILREIPPELEGILADPNILKLGVTPLNDAKLLARDYNTQVCSTLDLNWLYPTTHRGLAALAYYVLGQTLDKNRFTQRSNWEASSLTDAQKQYAADDAIVAIEIFKNWLCKRKNDLSLAFSRSSNFNIILEVLRNEIDSYLDVNFKPNHPAGKSSIQGYVLESKTVENKKKTKNGFITRQAPLYHNCFMHAPDGELLCSCDKRKAQWYVERGLAEVFQTEPYSIKLLFEPAARGGEKNRVKFYQQLKQNCCVVCGAKESYLKHNVVPKEYRKHFPNIMKDHQSHDVVLMCIRCHHLADRHNEILKQKLAVMCNAPFKSTEKSKHRELVKIKNCALALLNAGEVIPRERKIELENKLKAFFKVNNVTKSFLKETASMDTKIFLENKESHGIKVVNYFKSESAGLPTLEILWRKYFLKTMEPQYLPAFWSVTHNYPGLSDATDTEQ